MKTVVVYAKNVPRDKERSRVLLDALSVGQLLLCQNPKSLVLHGHIQIEALKQALSLCLCHYEILAGRLISPPPHVARRALDRSYISLCNAGVLLEIEETRRSIPIEQISLHRSNFPHEIGRIACLPSFCSQFHNPLAGDEPMTRLKVTHLVDREGKVGSILSFSFLHCIVDGFSASSFINSLASFYSGQVMGEAPVQMPAVVSFDRSELFSQATKILYQLVLQPSDLKIDPAATTRLEISCRATTSIPTAATRNKREDQSQDLISCLELQRVPGSGWGSAIRALVSLFKLARVEEARYPLMRSDLSSITLRLSSDSVQALQGRLANHPGLSKNDLLSSLIWCLFCSIRNRPLPSDETSTGALGFAIDLRKNCGVSTSLFGNSVWCLHVTGGCDEREARASSGGSDPAVIRLSSMMPAASPYLIALQSGARSIRRALQGLRNHPNPSEMISSHAEKMCLAPSSSQYHLAANVMRHQDAMISSWPFDYHLARFGSHKLITMMGFVLPSPPWSAAILASPPSSGGMDMILTVPSSAILALRSSQLLNELIPEGRFVYS